MTKSGRLALVSTLIVTLGTVLCAIVCSVTSQASTNDSKQTAHPPSRLMSAAAAGQVSEIRKLLRQGESVRATDSEGFTALHHATHSRNLEAVKLLIASGADIDARSKSGATPLIYSIDMAVGRPEISLALIAAGAQVNAKDADGESALWIATTESSIDVIEALLKKGADPNVQPTKGGFVGDTPLHMAAMNGMLDRVELLLKYNADPALRNKDGQTPIDLANKRYPAIREALERWGQAGRFLT